MARPQALSAAKLLSDGTCKRPIEAPLRGTGSTVEACGVNAKRCSTVEQAEHVKKQYSYPGTRIMLVRMIFANCISRPHALQRIAGHSAESCTLHAPQRFALVPLRNALEYLVGAVSASENKRVGTSLQQIRDSPVNLRGCISNGDKSNLHFSRVFDAKHSFDCLEII
jgi:hypothetical protein